MVKCHACIRLYAAVDFCGGAEVAVPCTERGASCRLRLEIYGVAVDCHFCNVGVVDRPVDGRSGDRVAVRCNDCCAYRLHLVRSGLRKQDFLCGETNERRNCIACRDRDDRHFKGSFLVILIRMSRDSNGTRSNAGDRTVLAYRSL